MLYLGNPSSESVRDAMRQGLMGQMCTPAEGRQPLAIYDPDGELVDWVWYAADNGCYGGKFPGADRWLGWLTGLVVGREHRCLFAVAPDEFCPPLKDQMGAVSLRRSLPFLADIRALGVPVALVAQNGLTPDMVPWADIDWIFLGGCRWCPACGWWPDFTNVLGDTCPDCGGPTPEWKESNAAHALAMAARERGKRVHMGRVNSRRRRTLAGVMGCDTVDGTFLAFGPDVNLPRLLRWNGSAGLFEDAS